MSDFLYLWEEDFWNLLPEAYPELRAEEPLDSRSQVQGARWRLRCTSISWNRRERWEQGPGKSHQEHRAELKSSRPNQEAASHSWARAVPP